MVPWCIPLPLPPWQNFAGGLSKAFTENKLTSVLQLFTFQHFVVKAFIIQNLTNIFIHLHYPINPTTLITTPKTLKLGKSAFKNTDTYKDQNVETEQVWLAGCKLRKV